MRGVLLLLLLFDARCPRRPRRRRRPSSSSRLFVGCLVLCFCPSTRMPLQCLVRSGSEGMRCDVIEETPGNKRLFCLMRKVRRGRGRRCGRDEGHGKKTGTRHEPAHPGGCGEDGSLRKKRAVGRLARAQATADDSRSIHLDSECSRRGGPAKVKVKAKAIGNGVRTLMGWG